MTFEVPSSLVVVMVAPSTLLLLLLLLLLDPLDTESDRSVEAVSRFVVNDFPANISKAIIGVITFFSLISSFIYFDRAAFACLTWRGAAAAVEAVESVEEIRWWWLPLDSSIPAVVASKTAQSSV